MWAVMVFCWVPKRGSIVDLMWVHKYPIIHVFIIWHIKIDETCCDKNAYILGVVRNDACHQNDFKKNMVMTSISIAVMDKERLLKGRAPSGEGNTILAILNSKTFAKAIGICLMLCALCVIGIIVHNALTDCNGKSGIQGMICKAGNAGNNALDIAEDFTAVGAQASSMVREKAEAMIKCLDNNTCASDLMDNLSSHSSDSSNWQEARYKVHTYTRRLLKKRAEWRSVVDQVKLPSKPGMHERFMYRPYADRPGEDVCQKAYNEYMRLMTEEHVCIYAHENLLKKEYFIHEDKVDSKWRVGEEDGKKAYNNAVHIKGGEEGSNHDVLSGSLMVGGAAAGMMVAGPFGAAAGAIAGMVFGGLFGGDEPAEHSGSGVYCIKEGFYSLDGHDGAAKLTDADHEDLKASTLENDKLKYILVPEGVCAMFTDKDSFQLIPSEQGGDKPWHAVVGPYEGNMPEEMQNKISSVAVWPLRQELHETVRQRGSPLTKGEILNEFDYQFQVFKWNRWKENYEGKCGADSGAVLVLEDRDLEDNEGKWWCIYPGTHMHNNADKRETELEQIPLSYFEKRDWMAADTKQLSPLHQVPHSFSTGDFQGSLRCHANQDKLSLREMYDKCKVDNDEVAMVVVPPRTVFYAQGENKGTDRNEGMFEVSGPHVGTVFNLGLRGDIKDEWNNLSKEQKIWKSYFDRNNPLASLNKFRGRSDEWYGKVSGMKVRRVGETPCTSCGCFLRKKKTQAEFEKDPSSEWVEDPQVLVPEPWKSQQKYNNVGFWAGTGNEFRTDLDRACPGGWYRDNREQWNTNGIGHGRIHMKEECKRKGYEDDDSYEYRWFDCNTDLHLTSHEKNRGYCTPPLRSEILTDAAKKLWASQCAVEWPDTSTDCPLSWKKDDNDESCKYDEKEIHIIKHL